MDTEEEDLTVAAIVDRCLSYDERIARIEAQASTMIERLRREKAEYEAYALPVLADYYERHRPRRGKTLHTVSGSIGYRTIRGGPRVVDRSAALGWAIASGIGEAITTRTELVVSGVMSYVERTGEIPPGVALVDDEERMYIRPPRTKTGAGEDVEHAAGNGGHDD